MKLTKEERLPVGKMLHEGSLSYKDCMEKYGVSRSACSNWAREYRQINGIPPKAPMGARAGMGQSDYGSMTKSQLLVELMRKDIEVARLKKGYAVKGGGRKKEFVSISGSSTK